MSPLLGLAVAVGLIAEPNTSEPQILWEAPASCPSADAFEARISTLRGPGERWAEVSAHARVRARPSGSYDLELSLRTADGGSTRRAGAADCTLLADAAALILAGFVEPVQVARRREPPADPPRGPDRPPGAPPAVEPASAPRLSTVAAASRPRPPALAAEPSPVAQSLGLRLGGVVGRATLPGVDLGPTLTLGWRRGWVMLEVTAMALAPRRHRFVARPETSLRLWTLGGGLAGLVVMPVSDRLEVPLGLALETSAVIARGDGVSRPRTAVRPWGAGAGVVRVVWWATPRWGVSAGAAAVVGLARPSFTVADQGPVAVGPGGLRAMLGVQRRWRP